MSKATQDTVQDVQHLGTNPGDPLPILEGHVSHGRFERVLKNGHFAVRFLMVMLML